MRQHTVIEEARSALTKSHTTSCFYLCTTAHLSFLRFWKYLCSSVMSSAANKKVKVKTGKPVNKKVKGKIGDKVLALEPEKDSVAAKAVKHVQKLKAETDKAAAGKSKRGIILLNHIPHGFYEEEMRAYFAQFGKVLRLRLARSKKTGKSKGYAFVEFEFEEVAKIVAEAMNGYLMYERLMKCELLPSTVNTKNLFASNYIREDNYPKLRSRRRVKDEQIQPKSEEQVKEFLQFRLKKLDEQNEKWASLGIKYKYTPPKVNKS